MELGHANKRKVGGGGGGGGGGGSSCVRDGFGGGLWKPIRKLGHLVNNRFSFVVGDGQRAKFWKDKWCGDTPFCPFFPCFVCYCPLKGGVG